MLLLVLLPFIPAVWLIAKRSIADAVLDVFLPTLIFVPAYYKYGIPHFMGISAWQAALFPIVVATLIKYGRRWRFQRADLWIVLFVIGDGIAEGRNAFSQGLRASFLISLSAFLPYILGKLLIEQEDLRQRFLRRLAWLAAFVAIIDVVEFRLSRNLFVITGNILFSQGSPNIEQIRAGYTRTQGPFGHAISAGIFFCTLWILSRWLSYVDKQCLGRNEPRFFGVRRSVALTWILFGGLFMTLSRGPWLGAVVAYAISLIGSAKHVKRTAILVILLGSITGIAAYSYLAAYTGVDMAAAKDQNQENAIYRRLLLKNYDPIAQEGGVFGWGEDFPLVPGQPSIDNQYLWLRLTQGPWGLWSFLLLAAESGLCLIVTARKSLERHDFFFSMSLLAALVGILLALTTVSLASPAYELLFLVYGWSLTLKTQTSAAAAPAAVDANYRFRRTFA